MRVRVDRIIWRKCNGKELLNAHEIEKRIYVHCAVYVVYICITYIHTYTYIQYTIHDAVRAKAL